MPLIKPQEKFFNNFINLSGEEEGFCLYAGEVRHEEF